MVGYGFHSIDCKVRQRRQPERFFVLRFLNDQNGNAQSFDADLTFDVRLYDGRGNLLQQQKTKGGTLQFNVSNLPNGIYLLWIDDGVSEKPEVQNIVVER